MVDTAPRRAGSPARAPGAKVIRLVPPTRPSLLARGTTCFALGTLTLGALPQFGLDTSTLKFVLVIVLLVLCLSLHEVAHGVVALRCGDTTARDAGRLTLNPIVHIDPVMTVILPAFLYLTTGFVFGGAKPVPVAFHRLRHPWRDMSLVALAGPLTNLLLAVLFIFLYKLMVLNGWYNGAADTVHERKMDLLPQVLSQTAVLNVVLTVFNLFPIPPLDGSRVLAWLLPDSLRGAYVGFERWGMFLVFALLCLPQSPLNGVFLHSVGAILDWLDVLVPLG
jgi:Zn-dependent protease